MALPPVKNAASFAVMPTQRLALALLAAVACSSNPNDQALDAYIEALRLSKTGGSAQAQLQQVDRCISIMPGATALQSQG